MAISDKLQSTLMAKNADRQFYGVRDKAAAQAKQDELRATGLYRRVEVRTFNNGSRARPLTGYFINVWFRDGLTADEREAAKAGKAPAPVAEPKPVVARMARYEAAYRACHGRTVSVTWTGDKVRVLEHGGDEAYALHLDAAELDAISARMEAKVAELAAARAAAAVRVRDDGFENLGDIFAEVEAKAIAEGKADAAREAARYAALSPEAKAAEDAARAAKLEAWADKFDVSELGDDDEEEADDDSDDADDDDDASEEGGR